jgi:hypothetical protein
MKLLLGQELFLHAAKPLRWQQHLVIPGHGALRTVWQEGSVLLLLLPQSCPTSSLCMLTAWVQRQGGASLVQQQQLKLCRQQLVCLSGLYCQMPTTCWWWARAWCR